LGGNYMQGPTVPAPSRSLTQAPITVKRHVVICPGCVILPGLIIGEGAVVGALSLVRNDIPAWQILGGVPASFIRDRQKELLNFEPLVESHDAAPSGYRSI
jgi:dTDP-4-amino-4,6-dideoxy-D-glucose acyltransferase